MTADRKARRTYARTRGIARRDEPRELLDLIPERLPRHYQSIPRQPAQRW